MKIGAAFPSKYLKAADLQGRAFQVQIAFLRVEDVGTEQKPEHKPVMYFTFQGRQTEKGLVLNRTNADTIAMDLGDETDNWVGHTVELFSMRVQGPNGMTDGIRCRVIHPTQAAPAQQAGFGTPPTLNNPPIPPRAPAADPFAGAPTPTQGSYGAPLNDDVPFSPF